MTSKKALELLELILLNHSSMLVINDKRFEYFNIIKERLEVLEKENIELKQDVLALEDYSYDVDCEKELLIKENEKLKKQIEDLEK